MISKNHALFALLAGAAVLVFGDAKKDAVQIMTYNPLKDGLFPVSSSLIYSTNGEEAILLDAQMTTKHGKELAEQVKKTTKNLKLIVITCGDPDFYFGLESIKKTFPNVKVVAHPTVIKHIRDTKDYKLKHWGPILKDRAPSELCVPDTMTESVLTVGGHRIEVRYKDDKSVHSVYAWIPGNRTILGSIRVWWGAHLFIADTPTPESRTAWCNVLKEMIVLKPELVIPGHYMGELPTGDKALKFTLEYLEAYEKVLKENNYKNSTAVINSMKKAYPNLELVGTLELSAKVNTGEMKWVNEPE